MKIFKNIMLMTALIAPLASQAGGLMMTEVGTADIGLASAGYGARAQDPSTLLSNPAGLTRLKGTQVQAGAQLLYGDMSFSSDSRTSPILGSDDGGNPVGLFPGASFFMSHELSEQITFGFGIASNFGLSESYDNNWQGRYYVQDATLLGISALPSIAYKVNDQFSVGLTLNIMTGVFDLKLAIPRTAPGDGQLKLEKTTVGFGANVGFMYTPDSATRIGLTYTSPVRLDFNADADFSGLSSAEITALLNTRKIDMTVTVPQTVDLSAFYQLDEKWALLGSLGWQDWSEFGYVEVNLNNISGTVNAKLKDTYHAALGAQYRLDTPWVLNFGASFDSGFQDTNYASPVLPANAGWKVGTGIQNISSENFEWGVSAEYQYSPEFYVNKTGGVPLGQGNLYGSYQPNVVVIGANAIWKF